MTDVFTQVQFSDLDPFDSFFDSLRADYSGFVNWFIKKQEHNESTYVFKMDEQIAAFLYLKDDENESIALDEGNLPPVPRIKIGTLKINENIRGKRLGEGAIGIALWHWFSSPEEQIYVTVYERHQSLIDLLDKFGFRIAGTLSKTSELVMVKDKQHLDYSNSYSSYPYIDPRFTVGGIIPVNETYHDKLFPYSTLAHKKFQTDVLSDVAGNGVTKMYVSNAYTGTHEQREPVLIYRRSESATNAGFKSVVTSIATIVDRWYIKKAGAQFVSNDDVRKLLGNKTVLTDEEISKMMNKPDVTIYKLVYNYYLGAGNNVNWQALKKAGMFEGHPSQIRYSNEQLKTFVRGLKNGNIVHILDDISR